MKKSFLFLITYVIPLFLLANSYPPYVINALGRTIYEGVFTGNGLLGTMTYQKSRNAVRIDVGRTDVYDHRIGENQFHLFNEARLPIGHFEISLQNDTISKAKGIMDMNAANAVAQIISSRKNFEITTTTIAEKNYFIIDLNTSEGISINFIPSESKSPRTMATYAKQPPSYQPNPAAIEEKIGEVYIIDQPLLAGGGYATAYKIIKNSNTTRIVASIHYSQSSSAYKAEIVNQIAKLSPKEISKDLQLHQVWWNNYMNLSQYHLPDSELQRFYDLQMYKLGCLTRADKPAIDLQGPWAESFTPWPAYWFNLNMQLTYSPIYTANRLTLGESLIRMIDNNRANLKQNIHTDYRHDSYGLGRSGNPYMRTSDIKLHRSNQIELMQGEAELSNLTWLLMSYYQHYRYSMDESLKKPLYELLKGSVNYALHFLDKVDGKYQFIVKTHSPEYADQSDHNTNYDLASLRWGMKILKELAGDTDTAYIHKIKEIEKNLIDYPKDENGYRISTNQSYTHSHRHYSHLMMIYPYQLIDFSDDTARQLALKSIAHWQSKKGALQGYSLSGAASMYATFGNGNLALDYIQALLKRFIQPNTLYKESGPVIETPLALATSLQELSLQYRNDTTYVFPAVPTLWKNVAFENFRTEGAFLISAAKKNDKMTVRIFSEYGGELHLNIPIQDYSIHSSKQAQLVNIKGQTFTLHLPKGSSIEIAGNAM